MGKRYHIQCARIAAIIPCSDTSLFEIYICIYVLLWRHMSLSDSDSSCTDEVMKLADKGKWGEFVKPRCFSRLSIGRMKNMNRLNRIYGLKCRHCLHELIGSIMLSQVTSRNGRQNYWITCMYVSKDFVLYHNSASNIITLQNDKAKDCDRHPPQYVWVQISETGKVCLDDKGVRPRW